MHHSKYQSVFIRLRGSRQTTIVRIIMNYEIVAINVDLVFLHFFFQHNDNVKALSGLSVLQHGFSHLLWIDGTKSPHARFKYITKRYKYMPSWFSQILANKCQCSVHIYQISTQNCAGSKLKQTRVIRRRMLKQTMFQKV